MTVIVEKTVMKKSGKDKGKAETVVRTHHVPPQEAFARANEEFNAAMRRKDFSTRVKIDPTQD